jgi:hypothetical protein
MLLLAQIRKLRLIEGSITCPKSYNEDVMKKGRDEFLGDSGILLFFFFPPINAGDGSMKLEEPSGFAYP